MIRSVTKTGALTGGQGAARTAVFMLAALLAAPAFAHDGPHTAASLAAGFAHPFSGLDHLLAMLAVGFWAARNKGRAGWILPLAFVLMMGLGAMLGLASLQLTGMETGIEVGIAVSIAALGLLIALAVRMPVVAGTVVVSLFALMHGYAHGVELPQGAAAASYMAGAVLATALLHVGGWAAGRLASDGRMARLAGAGVAASGFYLLAGVW